MKKKLRQFAEEVVRRHGRVTHIINNAGVALGGSVAEVSLDDMRWLMDINFWGRSLWNKVFSAIFEKGKISPHRQFFKPFRNNRPARTSDILRRQIRCSRIHRKPSVTNSKIRT